MTTDLAHFTATANRAASEVIDSYSTSFGKATRLLGERHRQHIRAIYALVRVADEIVDGVAAQAGLNRDQQRGALDRFEWETEQALETGYSADVVVHAFAQTAREAGITTQLTRPFFASMRMDLDAASGAVATYGRTAHDDYVFGSASVVGLMCLQVFLREEYTLSVAERRILEHGAIRLGEAFQDINFLRDLADDAAMGRNYLDDSDRLTELGKRKWVRSSRAALADAAAAVPLLPRDARAAVRCAHDLFASLLDRIDACSVEQLYARRVRVPDPVKALIVARAVLANRLSGVN